MSALAMPVDATFDVSPLRSLVSAVAAVGDGTAVLQIRSKGGVGGVFIEKGRIAWAAVPETRRYLSDKLVESNVPVEVIDALVAEGRATGRSLGELLVSRGVMSEGSFSQALYQHSLESLRHMAMSPITSISSRPSKAGGAALSFSFSPMGVISDLAARLMPLPELRVGQRVPTDVMSLAVIVRNGSAVPVRVLTAKSPELQRATQLASAGAEVMTRIGRGATSFRRGGRSWSVSGEADHFIVSEGHSAFSFSWMLTQEARNLE